VKKGKIDDSKEELKAGSVGVQEQIATGKANYDLELVKWVKMWADGKKRPLNSSMVD
jgi:hypothetical protein